MNRNNLIGWIFLVICFTASTLHAQKPVKVKGAQGRWQVSEEITLKQAEERAFMEAKKEALRKAGVMENVWSVFEVKKEDKADNSYALEVKGVAIYIRKGMCLPAR